MYWKKLTCGVFRFLNLSCFSLRGQMRPNHRQRYSQIFLDVARLLGCKTGLINKCVDVCLHLYSCIYTFANLKLFPPTVSTCIYASA
jgi:hypothetical protein